MCIMRKAIALTAAALSVYLSWGGGVGHDGLRSSVDIPLSEHPRPDWERAEWLNLNGAWDFGFEPGRYDRKIVVPFGWGSPLSRVKDEGDTGYYRRSVLLPAGWKSPRTFLVIGACDWKAEVSVDGKPLGVHCGGYTPFEFELTGLVAPGKPFELAIRCWDEPSGTAGESFRLYGCIQELRLLH